MQTKWLLYFDDELKVYRFVMKDSATEKAARASVIRQWAINNGFAHLEGRKGRLPYQVVRSYFLQGGDK